MKKNSIVKPKNISGTDGTCSGSKGREDGTDNKPPKKKVHCVRKDPALQQMKQKFMESVKVRRITLKQSYRT